MCLRASLLVKPELEMSVFYDGACATCRRDVRLLRERELKHPTRFVDARHGTDSEASDLLAQVHGADEEPTDDVDAVCGHDAEPGIGWLVAVRRVPGVSHGVVLGYRMLRRGRRWLAPRQPFWSLN
jgi:predicted DCC family thiol-disulfide oxidoreductase YuxK